MNALVVYESMFGNTKDIARAIADGLGGHTRVIPIDALDDHALSSTTLLVVGGPTHAWSMSRRGTRKGATDQGATGVDIDVGIRERLPEFDGRGVAAATFDTRIDKPRFLTGSAAKAIAKLLRKLGYDVIDTATFTVEDTKGPLIAGELDRAKAWGECLRAASARHRSEELL